MPGRRILVALGLMAMAGCSGSLPPPARWSLAHLDSADLVDRGQNPALLIDLMIAVKVARERCTGHAAELLNRREGMLLFEPENNNAALGSATGQIYRRAYGPRWWQVLAGEQQATRLKYENHPAPDAFCQTIANDVRLAINTSGADRQLHLLAMHRRLNGLVPRHETTGLP